MARVGGVDITVLYYYLFTLRCDWAALICVWSQVASKNERVWLLVIMNCEIRIVGCWMTQKHVAQQEARWSRI